MAAMPLEFLNTFNDHKENRTFVASREVGLEVNTERTKHIVGSGHQMYNEITIY
jgi:hypothetical protein